MNKLIRIYSSVAVAAVCLSSCTDDNLHGGGGVSGKEIIFGAELADHTPVSRTVYGDEKDNPDALVWPIYWLYDQEKKQCDSIFIYSPQGATGYQSASYVVLPDNPGQKVANTIIRTGASGVQTGDSKTHDFYAIYPASAGSVTEGVFTGSLPQYQKVQFAGWGTTKTSTVPDTPQANAAYVTTPDMRACVMTAEKKDVPTYAGSVSLEFAPFASVLDITINGPIDYNTVTGINNCSVVSVDIIADQPIAGKFAIDQKGNITFMGTNTITVTTTGEDQHHNLIGIPMSSTNTLRLQAFILPNPNISKLQVKVITSDAQSWTKSLNLTKFTAQKIHQLSLPGITLDKGELEYHRWMEQLDPRIYISELSIPGSLHSYAYNAPEEELQSLDLKGQFNAGIRAFRFGVDEFSGADQYMPAMSIVDDVQSYPAEYYGGNSMNTPTNPNYTNTFHLGITHGNTEDEIMPLSQAIEGLHALLTGPARNEFIIVSLASYLHADGVGVGGEISEFQYDRYYTLIKKLSAQLHKDGILVGPDDITPTTVLGDVQGKILLNVEINTGSMTGTGTNPQTYNNIAGYVRRMMSASGAPVAWTASSQINQYTACYSPISYYYCGKPKLINWVTNVNKVQCTFDESDPGILARFVVERLGKKLQVNDQGVFGGYQPKNFVCGVTIDEISEMSINPNTEGTIWLCFGDAITDKRTNIAQKNWTGYESCIRMIGEIGQELETRYKAIAKKPINTLFLSVLGCTVGDQGHNMETITLDAAAAWVESIKGKSEIPYGIVVMPKVTSPNAANRTPGEQATFDNIQRLISHNNEIQFRLARQYDWTPRQ